ncbi:MAG: hypothetical protein KGM24_08860 [Elusimicrobia bacterium]|nr:hypothetical protein [Elusimicrobiota bacterium]
MTALFASWFPGGSTLSPGDVLLFAAALGATVWLGRAAAARVASLDDYLLAGRRVPWPQAGLALVAAEVSALTVLGVSASAFRGDWTFLQFFLGAAAARVLVALLFVPAFHRGGSETPYGWLGARFGPRTRAAGAGLFVAARVLAAAARLLAAAVAAGALLGWGLAPSLVLLTGVSLAALVEGGAEAAVWTGVLQTGVVLLGGALAAVFLLRRVDGGLPAVLRLAGAAGKLRALDWGAPGTPGFFARFFGEPRVFWPAVLTGFFGSAAAFGTDHELAQKLLVARGPREAQKAMYLSIAGSLAVLLLFLTVGTLLFVFYKQNPGLALAPNLENVLPYFVKTASRSVVRGAVLAAIALASIDAPLASLSAAFVADLRRGAGSAGAELRRARTAALAFGLLLPVLAGVFGASAGILDFALRAGLATAGPVLGVFLLGLTSEAGGDAAALGALGAALTLNAFLLVLDGRGLLPFALGWLAPLGTASAYGLGRFFARGPRAG